MVWWSVDGQQGAGGVTAPTSHQKIWAGASRAFLAEWDPANFLC